MQSAVSLQTNLIKTSMLSSILAGIFALILLVGISVYQTMSVQDQIMDEIADMLMVSDLSSNNGSQVDELSDEFDIQYQLQFQQKVLTQSKDFPSTQLHSDTSMQILHDEEFSIVWLNHELWRRYSTDDSETELMVKMYQPLNIRFEDLLSSFLSYSLIILVLWLLQWGILNFAVKKQFKPLHALSQEIAEKNAIDLTAIQPQQPELKELQPIVSQLNKLFTRLEQSLVAEQRFTADASHELRSPLSAIKMRLQVLNRKFSHIPELSLQLDRIQNDINRGTQVLENLLLLARLDPTDSSQLPQDWITLDLLVTDAVQALEPLTIEKQINLHIDTEEIKVYGNAELIFTCIRNLIDNAIRYTPSLGNVYIHTSYMNNWIILEIENDGDEIPSETLARLGERFYRVLGTKTQGSGLGLSICKKVIELHQGKIEFKQSQLGGLKVTVFFKGG